MNLKVILFTLIALLFIGGLTYIEIKRFSSLTGYVINQSYDGKESVYIGAVFEILFLVVLFFFLSFVIKFIFNYHEKQYNHKMDVKYNYSKNTIPLDLSHPIE